LPLLMLGLILQTCSAQVGTGEKASSQNSVVVDIAAKNIAFNSSTITVPASANVTVNFDNQDAYVPHNFAVYDSEDAKVTIFQGRIITGPSKITYNFVAPDKPGTYFFRCDVHPTTMKGQFVVT
jgi:plastocyanin